MVIRLLMRGLQVWPSAVFLPWQAWSTCHAVDADWSGRQRRQGGEVRAEWKWQRSGSKPGARHCTAQS